MGRRNARVRREHAPDGSRRSTARDVKPGEEAPLTGSTLHGPGAAWQPSVARTMRRNLRMALRAGGDPVHGEAHAGRLPATRLTGERAPAGPGAETAR
ncbi:hypothetical protein DEF28_14850 [Marinitenerispora sediminis]|nr:hypothetical protein DEF28_14850 [Marinitenerispora sediminis]